MSSGDRVVVCGSIHAHRVVVPAAEVDVIGDRADAEREGARVTDIASILRVSPPLGPRRALRLITERSGVTVGRHLPPFAGVGMPSRSGATQVIAGDAARWLVMGESVSVRTLPARAFGVFPEWLTGVSVSVPFSGLVAIDGAFAIELDLTRLASGEAP